MKRKKTVQWVVAGLLLCPLPLLLAHGGIDWGDDYGAYLQQAHNLSRLHHPFAGSFTFYPYEECRHAASVPMGFPLVLAPAMWLYPAAGLPWLQVYMGLLLLAFAFYFICMAKKSIGFYAALAVALVFCYHPATLQVNAWLLSEIPFCLWVYASLYLYASHPEKRAAKTICLTMAVLTRSPGLLLLAAVVVHELAAGLRQRLTIGSHLNRQMPALLTLAATLLAELITWAATGSGNLMYYGQAGCRPVQGVHVWANVKHYADVFVSAFDVHRSYTASHWVATLLAVGGLLGWVIKCIKKPDAAEWFCGFYLLFFVCWFQGSQSLRFMLPVLPLVLYYLTVLCGRGGLVVATAATVYLLSAFVPAALQAAGSQQAGPFSGEGKLLVQHVQQIIPPGEVVVFNKARVLSFITGRQVMYQKNAAPEQAMQHYRLMQARWLIQYIGPHNWDLTCAPLDSLVKTGDKHLKWHSHVGNFQVWQLWK